MLHHFSKTIPAEIRDYLEWRRGRETYAVWVLGLEDEKVDKKFKAAREHLSGYLLEPYARQPHITLFVCGFLVETAQHNDDFTAAQFENQLKALGKAGMQPFEIEIGGLDSFASAAFLEVNDPQRGIPRLREALSQGAREFRTAPYTPHLTVGLYAGDFTSEEVYQRMKGFHADPIRVRVEKIAFATYRAQEIAGPLTQQHELSFV